MSSHSLSSGLKLAFLRIDKAARESGEKLFCFSDFILYRMHLQFHLIVDNLYTRCLLRISFPHVLWA